jgi:hypothetical protein
MLTKLWTIGVKVRDLEKELAFHRSLGNEIVLDETLEFEGERYRIPLVRMGDKYLHLAEKMVYEQLLDRPLEYGLVHLVYRSDSFDEDLKNAIATGATNLRDVAEVSAGFGKRRVAFLRAPGGWMFEIAEIITNLVPEV